MKCSTDGVVPEAWYVVRKTVRRVVFAVVVLVPLTTMSLSRLYACPLCKESLTLGMAKGFYWSILLMLSVPMVVVLVIASAVWRAGKRRGSPDARRGQSS